jgi:hypothetical protein
MALFWAVWMAQGRAFDAAQRRRGLDRGEDGESLPPATGRHDWAILGVLLLALAVSLLIELLFI